MGEENFLKEAFLPPYPHLSRTLKKGGFFLFFEFVRSTFVFHWSSAFIRRAGACSRRNEDFRNRKSRPCHPERLGFPKTSLRVLGFAA